MADSAGVVSLGHREIEAPTLEADAIGLGDSTVIAISSTAPAFSLAISMGAMVTAVGLLSPAALIVGFLPVLGVAYAYSYFNRVWADAGASFVWVSRSVSPYVGWFNGWVQLIASIVFMVSGAIPAGTSTAEIIHSLGGPDWTGNTAVLAGLAILWSLFILYFVMVGIRAAAKLQWVLLGTEYALVMLFSVAGIIKVYLGHPPGSQPISLTWFNPFALTFTTLAQGTVIAAFFYWGWDTALNVSEETKDKLSTPGKAGVLAMFMLVFIFCVNAAAMQALVPTSEIAAHANDALGYFASKIVGQPWAALMTLAVLSSTVATLQTTLLPLSRLSMSMAREKVAFPVFGWVHSKWHTPWAGTLLMAAIAIAGLLLTVALPSSLGQVEVYAVTSLGLLIAFYYGLTGIACAWYYRRVLTRNRSTLIFAGIFPAVGGIVLLALGVYTVISGGVASPASVTAYGAMALGVPLLIWARVANPDFFKRPADTFEVEEQAASA